MGVWFWFGGLIVVFCLCLALGLVCAIRSGLVLLGVCGWFACGFPV